MTRPLFLTLCLLASCTQYMTAEERHKIHLETINRVLAKTAHGIRPEADEINDAINTFGDIKQAQVRGPYDLGNVIDFY